KQRRPSETVVSAFRLLRSIRFRISFFIDLRVYRSETARELHLNHPDQQSCRSVAEFLDCRRASVLPVPASRLSWSPVCSLVNLGFARICGLPALMNRR